MSIRVKGINSSCPSESGLGSHEAQQTQGLGPWVPYTVRGLGGDRQAKWTLRAEGLLGWEQVCEDVVGCQRGRHRLS